jgi:hypothetical protein
MLALGGHELLHDGCELLVGVEFGGGFVPGFWGGLRFGPWIGDWLVGSGLEFERGFVLKLLV